MAGRLFFATAVAFTVGCVAVGFYDVRPTYASHQITGLRLIPARFLQPQAIIAVYEYNDRREAEKRPYEHNNHSDETLVDSSHEATKSHEARIVSRDHP
jgi:hypothetical protein